MAFGALLKELGQGQDYISRPSNSEQLVERKLSIQMPQKKWPINTVGTGGTEPWETPDNSTACLPDSQLHWFKYLQDRLPSRLNNHFIYDEKGTPAIYLTTSNRLRSRRRQLGEVLAKRIPSSSPLPLASEFNPSDELARFLVDGSGENRLTPAEAKKRLKRSVRSFIGTIADSLEDRQVSHVKLTEGGKFRENVARALLHRFPVGVYEQGDFLTALLEEITPVARSGQFGTISGVLIEAGGELVVNPTGHKAPPLLPDALWVKATTPGN